MFDMTKEKKKLYFNSIYANKNFVLLKTKFCENTVALKCVSICCTAK